MSILASVGQVRVTTVYQLPASLHPDPQTSVPLPTPHPHHAGAKTRSPVAPKFLDGSFPGIEALAPLKHFALLSIPVFLESFSSPVFLNILLSWFSSTFLVTPLSTGLLSPSIYHVALERGRHSLFSLLEMYTLFWL